MQAAVVVAKRGGQVVPSGPCSVTVAGFESIGLCEVESRRLTNLGVASFLLGQETHVVSWYTCATV